MYGEYSPVKPVALAVPVPVLVAMPEAVPLSIAISNCREYEQAEHNATYPTATVLEQEQEVS